LLAVRRRADVGKATYSRSQAGTLRRFRPAGRHFDFVWRHAKRDQHPRCRCVVAGWRHQLHLHRRVSQILLCCEAGRV